MKIALHTVNEHIKQLLIISWCSDITFWRKRKIKQLDKPANITSSDKVPKTTRYQSQYIALGQMILLLSRPPSIPCSLFILWWKFMARKQRGTPFHLGGSPTFCCIFFCSSSMRVLCWALAVASLSSRSLSFARASSTLSFSFSICLCSKSVSLFRRLSCISRSRAWRSASKALRLSCSDKFLGGALASGLAVSRHRLQCKTRHTCTHTQACTHTHLDRSLLGSLLFVFPVSLLLKTCTRRNIPWCPPLTGQRISSGQESTWPSGCAPFRKKTSKQQWSTFQSWYREANNYIKGMEWKESAACYWTITKSNSVPLICNTTTFLQLKVSLIIVRNASGLPLKTLVCQHMADIQSQGSAVFDCTRLTCKSWSLASDSWCFTIMSCFLFCASSELIKAISLACEPQRGGSKKKRKRKKQKKDTSYTQILYARGNIQDNISTRGPQINTQFSFRVIGSHIDFAGRPFWICNCHHLLSNSTQCCFLNQHGGLITWSKAPKFRQSTLQMVSQEKYYLAKLKEWWHHWFKTVHSSNEQCWNPTTLQGEYIHCHALGQKSPLLNGKKILNCNKNRCWLHGGRMFSYLQTHLGFLLVRLAYNFLELQLSFVFSATQPSLHHDPFLLHQFLLPGANLFHLEQAQCFPDTWWRIKI